MMNETKTLRRHIGPALLILACLSLLLIPGVRVHVAAVPATAWSSVTQAWSWLGATFVFLFDWL